MSATPAATTLATPDADPAFGHGIRWPGLIAA